MKRFILVSLLISIVSFGSYLVTKAIGDRTVSVYHEYPEYVQGAFEDSGYYNSEFKSGKPMAILVSFGLFAVLMTGNILYELYIVPKKKKLLENKA